MDEDEISTSEDATYDVYLSFDSPRRLVPGDEVYLKTR